MKKMIGILIVAAMVLGLCGCGGSGQEQRAMSQGTQNTQLSVENISDLQGEWVMEYWQYFLTDSMYAEQMSIHEDGTYEYGDQTGTWYFAEDTKELLFENSDDGVVWLCFKPFIEDGYLKLALDGGYCYVRKADHSGAFEKKYVRITEESKATEYFGKPVYIGTTEPDEEYPSGCPCYMLENLAYQNGLVYVGCDADFILQVSWLSDEEGVTSFAKMRDPYGPVGPEEGRKMLNVWVSSGAAYYVRSEYVEEIRIEKVGGRKVVLKNGIIYTDPFFDCMSYPTSEKGMDFLF